MEIQLFLSGWRSTKPRKKYGVVRRLRTEWRVILQSVLFSSHLVKNSGNQLSGREIWCLNSSGLPFACLFPHILPTITVMLQLLISSYLVIQALPKIELSQFQCEQSSFLSNSGKSIIWYWVFGINFWFPGLQIRTANWFQLINLSSSRNLAWVIHLQVEPNLFAYNFVTEQELSSKMAMCYLSYVLKESDVDTNFLLKNCTAN